MHRVTPIACIFWVAFLLHAVALTMQQPGTPIRASSLSIEAESLTASAQATHGRVVLQDMRPFGAGWSNDAQLFWSVAQPGAELRLPLTINTTGRYQVFVHFTRAPDYALVQASFDGAPWVAFNGYSNGVSRDRAMVAMRDVTPGPHELLFKVAMKDGASKGYNVGIDRIELEPVNAASSASETGSRGGRPIGSLAGAAGASMVEGGRPPVPVLHITSPATPEPETMSEAVEPLSAPARLSIAQRATSLPLHASSALTMRLTPSSPRIVNRAYLTLLGGSFMSDQFTDGWIGLPSNSSLNIVYQNVEAKQPLLFDCGVHLNRPADIRIRAYVHADEKGTPQGPELFKMSLPADGSYQHLLAVLIPEETKFTITLEPAGESGFSLRYCELTPFNK